MVLALRAVLPALLGITTGWLVADVGAGRTPWAPLAVIGACSRWCRCWGRCSEAISTEKQGHRLAEHLNDAAAGRLPGATCPPRGSGWPATWRWPGTSTSACWGRRCRSRWASPTACSPWAGLASAAVLFGYRWWAAPVLLASWRRRRTGCCGVSGVWKDRLPIRCAEAQQRADYPPTGRPVDPPRPGVRLFGLGAWVLARFRTRQGSHTLQYRRPGCGSARCWPRWRWWRAGLARWCSGPWPTARSTVR
ncbi:MAG: hypothetical protein R2755_12680 [Acidimicrobiales bacterium]